MDWFSDIWMLLALLVCVFVLIFLFSRGERPKEGS